MPDRPVIETLAELGEGVSDGFSVTASAGVARIGLSVDDTMRRAELALFLAKAKGCSRLEKHDDARLPAS